MVKLEKTFADQFIAAMEVSGVMHGSFHVDDPNQLSSA